MASEAVDDAGLRGCHGGEGVGLRREKKWKEKGGRRGEKAREEENAH